MQTASCSHYPQPLAAPRLLCAERSPRRTLDQFFRESAWHAVLTEEERTRIRCDAFERTCVSGAVACHRGEPANHWLGVIEGMVKVDTASACGRAVTFAGVPAGSWFGEGAVLKSEMRQYDVVAIRDSRIAYVPRETFLWLLERNHRFSRYVIDQLNARCGYYVGLVHNFRLHEAASRVAFCLAELFHHQLYPATERTLALSQEELGKLSGLSRQNTNRALRELADLGMIQMEYGAIVVVDLDRLRQYAHIGD